MKKFIIGFVLGALIFGTSTVLAATQQSINVTYSDIKISVNGTILNPDVEPFMYMNRTFVPARFIAEALNKDIKYNETTDTVEITDKLSVNTTSTGEVVEEVPESTSQLPATTFTPDGINTQYVDNELCVDISGFNGKYYGSDIYIIQEKWTPEGHSNIYILTHRPRENWNGHSDILLEDIPHVSKDNNVYISYDYYVNTILPLVK